jgi:hypothetical protein
MRHRTLLLSGWFACVVHPVVQAAPLAIEMVKVGMKRAEVIAALGQPESVSVQGGTEFIGYFVCRSNCAAKGIENRHGEHYLIRLLDGRVESLEKK